MVLRSLIALLLYFSVIQSASSEGIRLRYAQAYSALRTIFALPLFIAEREGLFVKEGLDFSMVPVSGWSCCGPTWKSSGPAAATTNTCSIGATTRALPSAMPSSAIC